MDNFVDNQDSFEKFLNDISVSSHKKMRASFLYSDSYKKMSLEDKKQAAKQKIKEFFLVFDGKTSELPVISFSGGKDSCVLKDLVLTVQKELKIQQKCEIVTSAEIFHPKTLSFITNERNKWIQGGGYEQYSLLSNRLIESLRKMGTPFFLNN